MSTDCSMSDVEGSSSDSDAFHNNNEANNRIDNAAQNILDNAAHQVVDNAPYQVVHNAAQNILDNAAHQVVDNAALNLLANAAHQMVYVADDVVMEEDSAPEASPDFKLDSTGSGNGRTAEDIMGEEAVIDNTLSYVIRTMGLKHYDTSKNQEFFVFMICEGYFNKDYVCKTLVNDNFSVHYPVRVIVPVCKRNENESLSMQFDHKLYGELLEDAPAARLQSGRFVIPTILFDQKYICRSGNLTSFESAAYEQGMDTAAAPVEDASIENASDAVYNAGADIYHYIASYMDRAVIQRLFANDVNILKYLKVKLVCGLMADGAKNYNYDIQENSKEKAKECGELELEELPFPDCEFFTKYTEANRNAKGLRFNWNRVNVIRRLTLTEDARFLFPEVEIEKFPLWDLIELTQNYLKILLSYLVTGTKGLVLHCLSGSDRTPLFISLLRLSLWADGVVHDTLRSEEIAYLTVAYDWFLFGHNLVERVAQNEEIMHFCFNFLQHITSDEYSITRLFRALPAEKRGNRIFPPFVPGKRLVLDRIRDRVLDVYKSEVRGDGAGRSQD